MKTASMQKHVMQQRLHRYVRMAEAAGVSVLLMCVCVFAREKDRECVYAASPDQDAGHIPPHGFVVNLVTQHP